MILAVNTAEEALQAVLTRDGDLLDAYGETCPGRMNEVMAPQVAAMLERHGGELTAAACVRGPGSFTGVRLGLAFLTGLCLARSLPMAGLDYLPLLAATAFSHSGAQADAGFSQVHVVTHSRSAKVYHQAFLPGSAPDASGSSPLAAWPLPVPLGPPSDLSAQAAREIIAATSRSAPAAVLGSGLRRNPDAFAGITGVTLLEIENPSFDVLASATRTAVYDGPPVDALYLRGSDAEENLAVIAKGRGLSEEEALERMEKAMK